MKKAMIIANPTSGKEQAEDYIRKTEEVITNLFDTVEVRKTEKAGDAAEFALMACEGKFDSVYCLGGDGTVNEVVNGLAGQVHRPRLGIVPLGTVNDFARALDIPLDPFKAIDIFGTPSVHAVDIGKINKDYFANVLAVGEVAEATFQVSIEQKTKLGSLAYFLEGIKAFLRKEPLQLTVQHDEGLWKGEAFLLIAALTNSVGGFESLAPDAAVNDGKFHVFIVKDLSITKTALMLPKLISGDLKESSEVDYFRTRTLSVSAEGEHAVNIDGEEGKTLPFEALVLPAHLHVYVPAAKD